MSHVNSVTKVEMVPKLVGEAAATVRRKLVECFLFEPACRAEGYLHFWFAQALSTLIDDKE